MMRPLAATGTCALLVLSPLALAGHTPPWPPAAPDLPPTMQRFLARGDEPVTSYRALRRLEAENLRFKKQGWLEAWTTLSPEQGFSFEVIAEGGSSYIRNKVLRKALEREREAHLKSESGRAALAPANYEFPRELVDTSGLVAIEMKPRRNDALLVVGRIYLRPDDADLVRVEGHLVKNPSVWTKRVYLTRRYGRIHDLRVPLATESMAQVVIAGESSFKMTYTYASINGLEVGDARPLQPAAPTPR